MSLPAAALYVFAGVLVVSSAAAHAQAARSYALVIGNNHAGDKDLPALRYADDDAARYFELFDAYADEVALLAVLDADTQRLHTKAAQRSRIPTRQAVLGKLAHFFARIRQDNAAGLETVLYFVYSGHGEVGDNQEGYVFLHDAPFTRSDLYREVIARSPATFNHVIIDACHSYFMVHTRGEWQDDRGDDVEQDLLQQFRWRAHLKKHPNTGVILSTSKAQEAHEWSAYQAGVFSHQLRSGFLGAADINGDGRIEYSEIKSYVASANSRVSDAKARIDIYAQAPQVNLRAPLFEPRNVQAAGTLRLGPHDAGRFHLEDARGVRYADFHKAAGHTSSIALLESDFYYVRGDNEESRIDLPGDFYLANARWQPMALAARGSVAESFRRHLFAAPFSIDFYTGYVASTGDVPVDSPVDLSLQMQPSEKPGATPMRVLKWSGVGLTAALAGATALFGYSTHQAYQAFEQQLAHQGTVNHTLQNQVDNRRLTTNLLLGGSILSGALTVVAFLLDRAPPPAAKKSGHTALAPSLLLGDGARVGIHGRF